MSKGTIIYIGGFNFINTNAASNMALVNARMFEKIGFKIVFIGQDKNLLKDTDILKTLNNISGFDMWSVPYSSSGINLFNSLTSTSNYFKVIEKYKDVCCVICYNFPSVGFSKIIQYCKNKEIIIISNSTEWYGRSGVSLIFDSIKRIDTYYRMKVLNRRVNALIVSSRYLADFYNGKLSLILPTFSPVGSEIDIKKIKVNSVPRIIYAGIPFRLNIKIKDRTTIKDRLDKAIMYLSEVKKSRVAFQFDIYGLTEKEYLIALPEDKKIIEGLGSFIRFHGRINSIDLEKEIKNADFTIFIRDINRVTMAGFPTKFTESVNCGTPVITTKTGDLEDYLIEGENGFFLDFDNKLAVEKLISILNLDSYERQNVKKRCIKNGGLSYYDWINKTEKFFDALLKNE